MPTRDMMNEESHESERTGTQGAIDGIIRLLRIAEYRQQTVLWTLAACMALGVAYYVLAPRYYTSHAKLMVIEQRGDDMPGMGEQSGIESLMATHKDLVLSPVVVQRAIDHLKPEHRIDLLDNPPDQWVDTVTDHLTASTVRKTNFIRIGYESRHPDAAAAVVRAVIDAYLGFVEETHRGTAAEVLDVLTIERDQLKEELTTNQRILRRERERMGHLALPDKDDVVDPVIARAISINDALMTSQQERISVQASLATVRSAIERGEDLGQYMTAVQDTVGERMMLSAMGLGENDMAVLADQQKRVLDLRAELDRVRPFYGASHPQVVSLEKQIRDTDQFLSSYQKGRHGSSDQLSNKELGPLMLSMLDQAYRQAAERERQVAASFEAARAEAARQSGDLVQLDMLDREVKRLERLHDVLFEKIKAVDIHQVRAPIRATIVEEPLPDDKPSSPQLRLVVVGVLLGGLGLGIAIAYVQDLSDDRFGSPDEMARQLGVRVLAVVRQLEALPGRAIETVQMYAKPQSVESEAFRTLRTSIALGSENTDRLVISSSEPSDGKTTVSANLAVSYAQSGKRTLIIDCDLRKPGLTALLDLKGKPGVTDILSASDEVGAVAQASLFHTPIESLDVIPAGPRRPDPAELLIGPKLGELLTWADRHYDQVLIDCPPVLAVSDAQIVGRLVDGVVLVVTPEKNHRRLVGRACSSFTGHGIPLLGVVANRVSEQAGRGYGYGYGYGYSYGNEELAESTVKGVDEGNNPRIAA